MSSSYSEDRAKDVFGWAARSSMQVGLTTARRKCQDGEQSLAHWAKFRYPPGELCILRTKPQEESLMRCPTCTSRKTSELPQKTALAYRAFRCSDCIRRFNGRSITCSSHRTWSCWRCCGGCATS